MQALSPLPALFWIGNKSNLVLLPIPWIDNVKMSLKTFFLLSAETSNFSGKTAIPITLSPFSSLIPVTPVVALPIGLTFPSGNLIDIPFLVKSMILSCPFVKYALINLSSPWSLIAIKPLALKFSNWERRVFLMTPLLVAKIKCFALVVLSIGRIDFISSPLSKFKKLTSACPFAWRLDSGISQTFVPKTLPLLVKNNSWSCVLAVTKWSISSSSFVVMPITPLPPLLCALYVFLATLLIYPVFVTVTKTSSLATKSSSLNSPILLLYIFVFLESPNFSFNSLSSLSIISSIICGFLRILISSSINFFNSWYSFSIFSLSKAANLLNCISRMAVAWISESLNLEIRFVFASSCVLLSLIVLITASKLSSAILRPSKMWALLLASVNSKIVLLTTTFCLCLTYSVKICLKFKVCGVPSTKATKFAGKVVWSLVCLNKLLRTDFGFASFLRSITTRSPSLSDSSLKSAIPTNFLSLTSSAILATISDLFTWYGISEITIWGLLPLSTISATPRTTILPLPVE